MYYAVEVYPKHEITIRNITDSEYDSIIEDSYEAPNRFITYRADGSTIKHGSQVTSYYNEKKKRDDFVCSILEADDYN